jgi:hypothetical protein
MKGRSKRKTRKTTPPALQALRRAAAEAIARARRNGTPAYVMLKNGRIVDAASQPARSKAASSS